MTDDFEHRTIAPPGCGKTTWLSRQGNRAAANGRNVAIYSLTRSAAAEIASREMDGSYGENAGSITTGTLHSQCYAALGYPDVAESAKRIVTWNELAPEHWQLSAAKGKDGDEEDDGQRGAAAGDALMGRVRQLRGAMTPEDEWPPDALELEQAWRQWKEESGLLDLTDLIEACLYRTQTAPGEPDLILVDECQDMDLLEMTLIRHWGRAAGMLVTVGDPDQCQPPGTMVETADGPVPIEELNPERHRLAAWNPHTQTMTGGSEHPRFITGSRSHAGRMLTVAAGGRETECTPGHVWTVQWRQESGNRYCVCLIRQGSRWWLSSCRTFEREGILRLGTRIRNGAADEAWILSLHPDRQSAAAQERALAAAYQGLPTRALPPQGATRPPGEGPDNDWEGRQAARCLADHGREPEFPLCRGGDEDSQGTAKTQRVRASNLLPGAMELPQYAGEGQTRWTGITRVSWKEDYVGPVYSLEVETHHHYAADGLVTHNCLYGWRGSDPDAFAGSDLAAGQERVLAQSFRIPRAVHAKAMDWIDRDPTRRRVEYQPRDEEGECRSVPYNWRQPAGILHDAERYLDQGKSVMFLTSCGYMLEELIEELRAQGIPFHNPLRSAQGAWNPLAVREGAVSSGQRLGAFLRLSEQGAWNAEDMRRWTGAVRVKEVVAAKSGRKLLDALEDDSAGPDNQPELSRELLSELLLPDALEAGETGNMEWFKERLTSARRKGMEFPMRAAARGGLEALESEPKVIPGTIHSAKGGEADVVYLFPDLSRLGAGEWNGSQKAKAGIYRMFYVGMTRARESLALCQPHWSAAAAPELDW